MNMRQHDKEDEIDYKSEANIYKTLVDVYNIQSSIYNTIQQLLNDNNQLKAVVTKTSSK